MNFLILSRLPDLYSTRRLVQEVVAHGYTAQIENPESPCTGLQFDVIIPRIGNFRYEEALENLKKLENHHRPLVTLNSAPFFNHARHKKQASLLLAAFPQPKLFESASHFPMVVKDCQSSQGEGVFLCRSQAELDECLLKLQGREVLFQEFISESQGHDIRAFVIGNKVTAVMERVSKNPQTEFRSNLSLGGHALATQLTAQEQALCIDVVQTLKLDYAGIDFVRSQRGPLILEVNPCPGFEGIENCSHSNIAKEVVQYAESLFRSNS
jgi:ribosomal protein S6--L-glutamate ligase